MAVFKKKKTMQYFEDSLPPQNLIRIHRTYLINPALITHNEQHEKESHIVLLSTDARLPLS